MEGSYSKLDDVTFEDGDFNDGELYNKHGSNKPALLEPFPNISVYKNSSDERESVTKLKQMLAATHVSNTNQFQMKTANGQHPINIDLDDKYIDEQAKPVAFNLKRKVREENGEKRMDIEKKEPEKKAEPEKKQKVEELNKIKPVVPEKTKKLSEEEISLLTIYRNGIQSSILLSQKNKREPYDEIYRIKKGQWEKDTGIVLPDISQAEAIAIIQQSLSDIIIVCVPSGTALITDLINRATEYDTKMMTDMNVSTARFKKFLGSMQEKAKELNKNILEKNKNKPRAIWGVLAKAHLCTSIEAIRIDSFNATGNYVCIFTEEPIKMGEPVYIIKLNYTTSNTNGKEENNTLYYYVKTKKGNDAFYLDIISCYILRLNYPKVNE
jgi:hypothetical protein